MNCCVPRTLYVCEKSSCYHWDKASYLSPSFCHQDTHMQPLVLSVIYTGVIISYLTSCNLPLLIFVFLSFYSTPASGLHLRWTDTVSVRSSGKTDTYLSLFTPGFDLMGSVVTSSQHSGHITVDI